MGTEKQPKYGQNGGGNRMPVQITSLLEGFFLAGEADRTRRYIAETMLEELNVMAEEGQFDKSKVPKLQIIRGWITSYAAVFKKKNAKRTLEEVGIPIEMSRKRSNSNTITGEN